MNRHPVGIIHHPGVTPYIRNQINTTTHRSTTCFDRATMHTYRRDPVRYDNKPRHDEMQRDRLGRDTTSRCSSIVRAASSACFTHVGIIFFQIIMMFGLGFLLMTQVPSMWMQPLGYLALDASVSKSLPRLVAAAWQSAELATRAFPAGQAPASVPMA